MKLLKLRNFLINVRTIGFMLCHVLFSQFKKLVSTRVVYDREQFNYEEYSSKCMSDGRLLTRTLFASTDNLPNRMAPGKYLMSEFFKFHKQEIMYD